MRIFEQDFTFIFSFLFFFFGVQVDVNHIGHTLAITSPTRAHLRTENISAIQISNIANENNCLPNIKPFDKQWKTGMHRQREFQAISTLYRFLHLTKFYKYNVIWLNPDTSFQ